MKYGTIGCKIAFSNTCQKLPIMKDCNRNLIQFTFSMKDVFSLFIFETDFILKIEDNCLLAFSSIDIKHKTR